jgi:hypothetical protein
MNLSQLTRRIGLPAMIFLPIFIILLLFLADFTPGDVLTRIAGVFWFLLLIVSIFVSIGGFNLSSDFKNEVKRLHKEGFPIQSVEGFKIMNKRIRTVFTSSFFVSVIIFISFLTFLLIEILNLKEIETLIKNEAFTEDSLALLMIILGFSLILIAVGIAILITLPEKPTLVPGALLKYYEPTTLPTQIDNFLSDSIIGFLDPITRTKWDEWKNYIANHLKPSFFTDQESETRPQIAREKILLLAYLNVEYPDTINQEVIHRELLEILDSNESIIGLMEGKGSKITWKVLQEIMREVEKEAPEIFEIIDRLIVTLRDDLKVFKDKDIFITVTDPNTVSVTRHPFRILVFILNKNITDFKEIERPITINLVNDKAHYPDKYDYNLDEAEKELNFNAKELPFTDPYGIDIVGVLGQILQVGDAIWFQIAGEKFGNNIFNIRIEEPTKGNIYGKTLNVRIVRDLNFYLKTYGGRITAIGGAILPILSFLGISSGWFG